MSEYYSMVAKNLIHTLGEERSAMLANLLEDDAAAAAGKSCCQYIITRGEKKGQQCTIGVSGGDAFCSKHRKTVNKPKTRKRPGPKADAPVDDSFEIVDETLEIFRDERGRYKEPKSGFLFSDAAATTASGTPPTVVYGKADSEGNILPLDKKDLMIVGLHGWEYKPHLHLHG